MSIYDKSSLVLIPSGTKTGKVYSQKPVSGDGDFTFTRSSAATRVNADGNIEKETQNLLLQSNTFSNTWTNASSTETSGQSGYDGTNDAWLLTSSLSGGRISQSVSQSGLQTFSVYLKAGSRNWALLVSTATSAYFDLVNGVVGSGGTAPIDANIESIGSGWYRCSITASGSNSEVRIYPALGDNDVSGTGTIYIQDAQLEQGLVAKDYIETTSPVEGGITDNVPRLDYTDSSCPALLLEPSRTNIINQSEYFGAWNPSVLGISLVVSNYAISPEGVQNAAQVNFIVQGDSDIGLTKSHPVTGGSTYAYSIYIKGEGSDIGKDIVVKSKRSGGDPAGTTTTQTLTGEWQRVDFTTTYAANNTAANFYLSSNDATSVLVYGAQVELGSYKTSYIPTYGSSVTRVGDMASIIPVSSSVIDTSKAHSGFIEIKSNGVDLSYQIFGIDDNSYNNFIKILQNSSQTNHRLYSRVGGGSYLTSSYGTSGQYNKYAWTYDGAGTLKYFVNGSLDSTHSATFPVMSNLGYGERSGDTNYVAHSTNQILLFNQALTDQEMIDLTTL